jgi:xanthosine utilization system XapX-like protein
MEKFRELARTPWRTAVVALLGALLVTTIYRAATQAISHDEALTFEWFQSGPWSQLFGSEFGNHHPLNALFSRVMMSIFGLSEFSLRFPSVVGGALYFYAIFRICAFLLGEGALFLLGIAFLSLNPFLLDYLCIARGYSLGMGFFLYAIYQLMLYLSATRGAENPNRLLNKAGVAVGLSIGCNVIMIFPTGALALAFFAILITEWMLAKPAPGESAAAAEERRKKKKERKRKPRSAAGGEGARSAWQAMIHLAGPAFLVAGIGVTLPRKLVYLEEGYLGPPSLFAILEGIVRPSLLHSARGQLGLAALLPPDLLVRMVTYFVAPVVLLGLVMLTIAMVYQWARGRSFDALPETDRLLLLLGVTMPAALLMIVASRYWFGQPYPEMRTVLYWIPLFGLASLALVKRLLAGSRAQQIGAAPAIAFMVLCVVQFATQFNTRYYAEWAYCAATKDMMEIIRAQHAAKPDARVRVGASWEFEPGINFYRAMWQLVWMEPVFRESPDADYDYYLLLRDDISLVERRRLKLLLKDDLSRSALAKAGA